METEDRCPPFRMHRGIPWQAVRVSACASSARNRSLVADRAIGNAQAHRQGAGAVPHASSITISGWHSTWSVRDAGRRFGRARFVGQGVDPSPLEGVSGLEIKAGTVQVSPNMMTGHPGIFAGGDMVPSKRTVTVAVGHGKKEPPHDDGSPPPHAVTGSARTRRVNSR